MNDTSPVDAAVVLPTALLVELDKQFQQHFLGPSADYLWQQVRKHLADPSGNTPVPETVEDLRHVWSRIGGYVTTRSVLGGRVEETAHIAPDKLWLFLQQLYGKVAYWAECNHQMSLQLTRPVDMILHCPRCCVQHIDATVPGVWDNPPHRSHLCDQCGCVWRPADVATNGVAAINTRGSKDNWSNHDK